MASDTVTIDGQAVRDLPCVGVCSPATWPDLAFVCSAFNSEIDGLCSRHWGHDGDHVECTKDVHAVHVWPRTAIRWEPNPAIKIPDTATIPGGSEMPPSSPATASRAPGAPPVLMTCCGGYPGEHFAGCGNEVA